jgi:hypothetical protein
LVILAILGLLAGGITTYLQYRGRVDSDKRADKADRAAKDLRDKMAAVGLTDEEMSRKMNDLTALNGLGDGHYYVVIDTFRKNSPPDDTDFQNVKSRLNTLFPNAEGNGLLWTADTRNEHYELRFGRHLSPSAAEMFWRLADQGLANGKALIRRE